jgi:lysophospholipase L1-like esterase
MTSPTRNPMSPRLKAAAGGLLTTAFALLTLLIVSEVALRIYTRRSLIYDIEMSRYATEIKVEAANSRIGHVHKPNTDVTLMGVRVTINSDGFRDREYPIERGSAQRIIALGDSVTFGWGTEKAKTFEELLEAELSRADPTEIINFGTGNYNTDQEVALFREKGLKYRPDEVVVFYFINDAEPTPRRSGLNALSRIRTITFFWSRLNSALTMVGGHKSFRTYYTDLYADDQPGWIAAKRAFIELRDVCRSQGITLRVVLLPEFHVLDDYPFHAEHRKILAFLKDIGVDGLDLAPFFAQEKHPKRLWVATDDAHPNEIAHAAIARHAREFIQGGLRGRKITDRHSGLVGEIPDLADRAAGGLRALRAGSHPAFGRSPA